MVNLNNTSYGENPLTPGYGLFCLDTEAAAIQVEELAARKVIPRVNLATLSPITQRLLIDSHAFRKIIFQFEDLNQKQNAIRMLQQAEEACLLGLNPNYEGLLQLATEVKGIPDETTLQSLFKAICDVGGTHLYVIYSLSLDSLIGAVFDSEAPDKSVSVVINANTATYDKADEKRVGTLKTYKSGDFQADFICSNLLPADTCIIGARSFNGHPLLQLVVYPQTQGVYPDSIQGYYLSRVQLNLPELDMVERWQLETNTHLRTTVSKGLLYKLVPNV